MTEQRLRTYERLLGYVLLAAVILGIVSQLTGCDYYEVDTKYVIDYRFTEAHTETDTLKNSDGIPYYVSDFVPEKYERLWEYVYKDGHKERHWEECTRFEYEDAKKELGG